MLVGWDGRDGGRDALAMARGLGAIEGAELIIAASLDLDPLASPPDAYERAMREAEDRVRAEVETILASTSFRLRIVGGVSTPPALAELAEDERADVIVLGSTHREGLGRVLPGGVGERLLHGTAPCAVLVTPSGFASRERLEIQSIGVGYDGREQAGHAREVAGRLAADLGAALETVTASPDEGDPAEVLARRSRDLDLLVIGSRGYGPVRHALIGNVSTTVMRTAACPVLVVPRSVG
jgi:nucleotide-binding universal stress UspA family protein